MTLIEDMKLLSRYRLWLIGMLVAISALIDGVRPVFLSHFQDLGVWGRRLLSADGLHVFDDSIVQVGPLHLIFNGLIDLLAEAFAVEGQVFLSMAVQVIIVVGLIMTARGVADLHGVKLNGFIEFGIAVVALAMTLPWVAYLLGHPADAFIPLLWIAVAGEASRGRSGRAGLLLAAAGLLEPWGFVGLPLVIFGTEDRRAAFRSAAIAVILGFLVYAPFFAVGSMAMFDRTWIVSAEAPLAAFLGEGASFGWGLRLVQFAAATGVGLFLTIKHRGRHSIWVTPLLMVTVFLALDPSAAWFQWIGPQALALVGVASLLALRRTELDLFAAALAYPLFLTWGAGGLVFAGVLFAVIVILLDRKEAAGDEPTPVRAPG